MNTQLDLFGEVLAEETRRYIDALTCLRDSHPNALEVLIGRRRPDTGEVQAGLSGDWAYRVRRDGFYFEDRHRWGGWFARPAHHVTWDELDHLVASDPRLHEVRTWATSVTAMEGWRDLYRPCELWPDPESWHPSYINGDHERPGWEARITAWRVVLAILDDAIGGLR